MDRLTRELELRRLVAEAQSEYNRLNDRYDSILGKAHECAHGSPEMIAMLREANFMAPEFAAALKRYHDAVGELLRFYASGPGSPGD